VVLTAVLSCLNSGLYTASRMLFVLAGRDQAPKALVKLSPRGVPFAAIVFSSAIGFVCVLMSWLAPRTVFLFLLNSSGAIILFVYWLIALSQIVLRRRTPEDQLALKMWFFPVLSILTLAGITAVLVQMAFDHAARSQLWLSLLSWAVVLGLYFAGRARRARTSC
jgi:GABA permease